MKIKTFRIGGIHPPENKTAPANRIIDAGLPMTVRLPLRQHIGAEAQALVKVGDHVVRGQKVADAAGKISAPVHASISGTVKAIAPVRVAQGRYVTAMTIAASEADHLTDLDARERLAEQIPAPWHEKSPEDIAKIVADNGIVGMGGATFPSAVKLTPPPGSKVELLIINACECEPCLTCDDALMQARAPEIITGTLITMRACGAPRAIIGIENNKPAAFAALQQALSKAQQGHEIGADMISIQILKPRYPQGGEKQLITALTGREVPSGSLPIAVGCVVHNVATVYAIYQAVCFGFPLIERVVTVSGQGNYLVPIGMSINELPVDGAVEAAEADVVAGGPMMGQSTVTLDAPVVKGLSGITIQKPLPFSPEPCLRCGACSDACPMGLESYLLATYGRLGMAEEALKHGAMDCIECGCCSYSCPSARPVLDFIKLAKRAIRCLPKK